MKDGCVLHFKFLHFLLSRNVKGEKEVLMKKTKLKKKRKISNTPNVSSTDSCTKDNIWGATIPPEVLLVIFRHVVAHTGSLPFLCRLVI